MSPLPPEQATPLLRAGAFLARVLNVNDPENQNRIQVQVNDFAATGGQAGSVWARLMMPFPGANRGGFFIPDVGNEVLVTFLSGDTRFPVVLGGIWNGGDVPPSSSGSAGSSMNRRSNTGDLGTKIAIVEDDAEYTIHFDFSAQRTESVSSASAGRLEPSELARTSIKINGSGITIDTASAQVQIIAASNVTINAPQLNVNAAMSTFSGIVECQVLQATTVVAETYTPGAGNVW